MESLNANAALLVIDVQQGFSDPQWRPRTIPTRRPVFVVFSRPGATPAFDQIGVDGRKRAASEVHFAALSDLNGEFATVVETQTLLASLLLSERTA